MRVFETTVQELKDGVLREVAALAWEDNKMQTGVLDIPEKIIPGPEAKMRCCIYKERAVVSSRVKMALGGDRANPAMVEVMNVACDECPVTQMTVGPACRGCIATRCVHACPKDAITVINHKAEIDHSKCILCGKCLNACPYGAIIKNLRPCERACKVGAITMGEDKKAAVDYGKCISCGACVYQCPFGAIMDKSYIVDVVEMLRGSAKWGYRVYAVLAPSIMGQLGDVTLGQLVTGLKEIGFCAVREVALGADMTAKAEAEELLEKKVLTSSCCPAFVDYVEKNFPKIAHLVSGTPSPMVMIGRHIKEQDPRPRWSLSGPAWPRRRSSSWARPWAPSTAYLLLRRCSPCWSPEASIWRSCRRTPWTRPAATAGPSRPAAAWPPPWPRRSRRRAFRRRISSSTVPRAAASTPARPPCSSWSGASGISTSSRAWPARAAVSRARAS